MPASLAQFVDKYKSQGWGYFGIRMLGRYKTSFCGLGMGAVIRRCVENNVLCFVLFCPHLDGGMGCCEGVILLSKKINYYYFCPSTS